MIAADIDTATDRVLFLQTIGRAMFAKSRIKLNLRKLYTADGHAVRELLKIARLLYDASRSADAAGGSAADGDGGAGAVALPVDAAQMRAVRDLAAEVQAVGNRLQEALLREADLARARQRAAFSTDSAVVEDQLREAVQAVHSSAAAMEAQAEGLEKERRALEAKMKKRGDELERQRQRLTAVQGVRPAYMAEHERLQGELGALFAEYLERHRNLEYLQRRLEAQEARERKEAEDDERRMRKVQAKMQREMAGVLGGNHEVDDSGFDSMESGDVDLDDDDDDSGAGGKAGGFGAGTMRRPMQPSRGAKRPGERQLLGGEGARGPVLGSLAGGGDADDSSLSGDGLSEAGGSSGGVSFGDDEQAGARGMGGLGGRADGMQLDDEFGDEGGAIYGDDSDSSDGGF